MYHIPTVCQAQNPRYKHLDAPSISIYFELMNQNVQNKIIDRARLVSQKQSTRLTRLRERLAALAKTQPPPDYDRYIRSKTWQKKREQLLDHHGRACVLCGSTEHLHVHHLHYQTVGAERPEDVAVCCRRCHFIEHLPYNDNPNWTESRAQINDQ